MKALKFRISTTLSSLRKDRRGSAPRGLLFLVGLLTMVGAVTLMASFALRTAVKEEGGTLGTPVRNGTVQNSRKERRPDPKPVAFRWVTGRKVLYRDFKLKFDVEPAYATDQVRKAMIHAWDNYKRYAWGGDELAPLSKGYRTTFGGCTGITILDAADTLFLMGLTERFKDAKEWIGHINFSCVRDSVSTFETTIRSLGGLISLYELSGDAVFLQKAQELGHVLKLAYGSESDLPARGCVPFLKMCETTFFSNIAEVGTQLIEWRALAYHTRDPSLLATKTLVENVMLGIVKASPTDRLTTSILQADRIEGGGITTDVVPKFYVTGAESVGAEADSYFEYLLKAHIQGGSSDKESHLRREYERQMRFVLRDLISRDWPLRVDSPVGMEHLSCFLPGALALSIIAPGGSLRNREEKKWRMVAEGLTESCYLMYALSPIGLSGDSIYISRRSVSTSAGSYQMRPEAIEAMFYMWRLTKKEKYRAWAWKIFKAIERHAKVSSGYCGVDGVYGDRPHYSDTQQSFFLAETLKYLFLIFSDDDLLPLDKWVFNTEAHPVRIRPEIAKASRA